MFVQPAMATQRKLSALPILAHRAICPPARLRSRVPPGGQHRAGDPQGYAEAVRTLGAFLVKQGMVKQGMPTDVAVISREHVEAFISDQLERWRPGNRGESLRAMNSD